MPSAQGEAASRSFPVERRVSQKEFRLEARWTEFMLDSALPCARAPLSETRPRLLMTLGAGGGSGTLSVTILNICSHCHPECRLRSHSPTPSSFTEALEARGQGAPEGGRPWWVGGEPGWSCTVPSNPFPLADQDGSPSPTRKDVLPTCMSWKW